jgi:hypothetical protein
LVIKPPTTYPENIIADRVWDDVRSDVDGSGLDSIAISVASRRNGTLRERFWYDAMVILMSGTLIYRIKRWNMI